MCGCLVMWMVCVGLLCVVFEFVWCVEMYVLVYVTLFAEDVDWDG